MSDFRYLERLKDSERAQRDLEYVKGQVDRALAHLFISGASRSEIKSWLDKLVDQGWDDYNDHLSSRAD